ncbi:hypothetical protein BGZ68_003780 [Mortierella alpina]|nr:hypothetical protein BGZ68_003780 [Mortierella alpina]
MSPGTNFLERRVMTGTKVRAGLQSGTWKSHGKGLNWKLAPVDHNGTFKIDRTDAETDTEDTNTSTDADKAQPTGTGYLKSRASIVEEQAHSDSSSQQPTASSITNSTTTAAAAYEHYHQLPQDQKNSFLTSSEARLILDLPSLLGKDPGMIPDVLAMPVPLQPSKSRRSSSASSPLLAGLDAKAEATAKAMTKRYAAKNLNMTETEAHRMVQVMAAEIVALHEEREVLLQKMQVAKEEMLEAARLLRMKADQATGEREREDATADASLVEAEEMQDMSSSTSRSVEKARDDSDEDELGQTGRQ